MLTSVKRWWILPSVVLAALVAGVFYVFFQLIILQPPVVEPNFNERKRSERFVDDSKIAPISSYPVLKAGKAALYHAAGAGRTLVMLPDSGTGAWMFEKVMGAMKESFNLYSVSYRGMTGAETVQAPSGSDFGSVSTDDYLQDATDALSAARKDSGQPKIMLVGSGLGAMLALKLANRHPDWLEGLVLIAPFVPRERNEHQAWLARTVGDFIYRDIYTKKDAAQAFWNDNFANGFAQKSEGKKYLELYAKNKVPFEFKSVLQDVYFNKLAFLEDDWTKLENSKLPMLQIAARYDVTNPIGAQRLLRTRLEQSMAGRYSYAVLNSGKYVTLDWHWKDAVGVLASFLPTLKLEKAFIQNEEALDPLVDPPDK
jgi:pimeloyl-ACP methyl ester carboxylesterase